MPGKVFISCGQATPTEKKVANRIRDWLKRQSFDPYIAIQTQSIQDVNSGIIGNLRAADYYIFIDFRRERIHEKMCESSQEYRGSLFTNQELAIAYTLGFDQALFLQQTGIRLEGIGRYILSNARRFDNLDEVPKLVREEFKKRGWKPDYSRHLVPTSIHILNRTLQYRDHTGIYNQYICHIEIENRRNDFGAFSTIARLDSIDLPSNQTIWPDSSYLKWAGQSGYERTLLPRTLAKFDAFAIEDKPGYDYVYLHSSADVLPRQPILQNQRGQHTLSYQVFAQGFPILEFKVVLNLTGRIGTTTVKIV